MSGPFPKPIYTINGLSPSGNTGNIAILGTGGISVSGSGSTITISGSGGGGGSVPAPTANGQVPIGSTGGTFTTTTLTAGPGISIANGPGSVTISAPSIQPAQAGLVFQSVPGGVPGVFIVPSSGPNWDTTPVPSTARIPLSGMTPISPATNITVGTHNITFAQAGMCLIQLNSCLGFSTGINQPGIQLVKNDTTPLFTSFGYIATGQNANVNMTYIASFAIGDTIDFRALAVDGGGGLSFNFQSLNILVQQLPTSI